jgi:hypothetical protein
LRIQEKRDVLNSLKIKQDAVQYISGTLHSIGGTEYIEYIDSCTIYSLGNIVTSSAVYSTGSVPCLTQEEFSS